MAIRLARLLRLNFTHTSLGRSTSAPSLVFAQFSHTRRTILELPFSRNSRIPRRFFGRFFTLTAYAAGLVLAKLLHRFTVAVAL